MQLRFHEIVMKYSYWYCDDKKLKKKKYLWDIKICTANIYDHITIKLWKIYQKEYT